MKNLFNDICDGLIKQGYKDEGGNFENFRILSKGRYGIKVYLQPNNRDNIIIRYYFKKGK